MIRMYSITAKFARLLLMVIVLLSVQANAAFRNVTSHLKRKDTGVNSRG